MGALYDAPHILSSVTELAACHTGAKTKVADTDGIVLELIREIVFPFCHGSDEYADAFLGSQSLNVILDANHLSLKTECDFSAVGG